MVTQYVSTVNGVSTTYNYTYDANGYITKIVCSDGSITEYEYDNLGQLTLAKNYNSSGGTAEFYSYDKAGNRSFVYGHWVSGTGEILDYIGGDLYYYDDSGWGDQFMGLNSPTSVTYDAIGNPIYYMGFTFTWEGRRLVGAAKGDTGMVFTYDDNGLRTSKTVGEVTTTYVWNGTQLFAEITDSYIIVYVYEADGSPIGMQYLDVTSSTGTWEIYWYEKNLQGDIVSVYNNSGTKLVKYTYDAWGKITATSYLDDDSTNAAKNPFRYRGYYYDTDLGMYYLQSRYYDAYTGRFINADSAIYDSMLGYNMFAYCYNNPMNYKQRPVSNGGSVVGSSISSGGIYSSGGILLDSVGSSRVNWENGGFQIPIWISSLMSGSDFGASIAPALRTIYQYIRYPGVKDLNKLYGLDLVLGKLNTACSAIGYGLLGLNIGLSAWSNFTNDNLTTKQQWISFGVDTAYTLGTFGIGYGFGVLVSLIPGVGVFIAPVASAGVAWFIDWTNENWGWLDDVKQWFNDL